MAPLSGRRQLTARAELLGYVLVVALLFLALRLYWLAGA